MAGVPPRVPQLQTTLSHVSPDKAAEIRSAVSKALKYHQNGMFSFQESVETTFVLPWDLNPKVEPQKLSKQIRNGIREQLMDPQSLNHLEGCGSINYSSVVQWQYRPISGGEWSYLEGIIGENVEVGYNSPHLEWQFMVYPNQFQVNYSFHKLMKSTTQEMFEIRRIAFSLLLPLKTEGGSDSLFNASSLGLWGVHDRVALLSQAVMCTLGDTKGQVNLYDRWVLQASTSPATSPASTPGGDTPPHFAQWEAAKNNIIGNPSLHIFVLSNVIQRPIVVYSHPESNTGGVYLPLLWEGPGGVYPSDSHPHLRNPLVLGYDCTNNHFVPLVTFKGSKGPDPIILPLHYGNGRPLPIHFATEAERKDQVALLTKLMYVDYLSQSNHPSGQTSPRVLVCIMNITSLPEVMDQLIKRYQSLFL